MHGGAPAYICQECVELCSSIFEHRRVYGDSGEQDGATQLWMQEEIERHLAVLTSLEKDVIRFRYGLADGCTYTLKEVGGKMGIAPQRVSVIQARALRKLRQNKRQP